MKSFDEVAAAVDGVPFMSAHQGRIVYDHVQQTQPMRVLELGSAHGVGSAYLAAALPEGARVITVDHEAARYDPAPEDTLRAAGLLDRVDIVRQYSSYTWWLKEQLSSGSEGFDFVYLDGAKNWTIDGLAVLLIERLLRPGGWLLMDDLHWSYDDVRDREVSDGVTIRDLTAAERSEPHLRAVFDLLVVDNPAFTDQRITDDWWGWARKRPDGEPVRQAPLRIETTRTPGALVANMLRRGARAVRHRTRD